MRRNKPGLADLKKLHQEAQPPDRPPSPTKPQRAARRRSPFLPPSPALPSEAGAVERTAGPQTGAEALPGRGHEARTGHSRPEAEAHTPAALQLSEADRRLFRSAVRYVERIKDPGRVLLAPEPVAHASILKERRMRAAGLEPAKPAQRPAAPEDTAKKAAPQRKPKPLSDNYAPATHDHDDSHYLKTGHGTDILRDLRRGKWAIGASLDLHGSTVEDARERFERFLSSCLTHEVKCVRIVHGKGYGSRNGDAVLKSTVRRWLTQITEVIAYTECAQADGGAGAVQVLLK